MTTIQEYNWKSYETGEEGVVYFTANHRALALQLLYGGTNITMAAIDDDAIVCLTKEEALVLINDWNTNEANYKYWI